MQERPKSAGIGTYLLALLHADNDAPTLGRIMLIKQSFLLFKEIVPDLSEEAQFFPYQWGPYSNVVARCINRLFIKEYITVEKKGRDEEFSLMEEGKQVAQEAIKDIPDEILHDICRMKKTTRELGLKRVLRFIYSQYPQYTRHSRGKNVYVPC